MTFRGNIFQCFVVFCTTSPGPRNFGPPKLCLPENPMLRSIILNLVLVSFSALYSNAQKAAPPTDWFLKDPERDHLLGVSADRTYDSLLKGQPSRTIIVAVVDSGIDIEHEDLKSVIWTNPGEIPGNGIDDDHNGYIDDIH